MAEETKKEPIEELIEENFNFEDRLKNIINSEYDNLYRKSAEYINECKKQNKMKKKRIN